MRTSDIHLRDPFVLPVEEHGTYYLYGTIGETAWGGRARGFDVYASRDLFEWEGPFPAFRPGGSFWADHHFWAPEVHAYRGAYYMFASFKAEERCRAVQILKADHPLGPFAPHGNGPITPGDWDCLDGTLYVDEEGQPWLVFCHEWLQVRDGEMCAVRLADDLTDLQGEPVVLFRASEAAWVVPVEAYDQFVTDGPFLVRSGHRALTMMWSSHGKEGYAIGVAKSESGNVLGPWVQQPDLIFAKDGGHGMLFKTFQGEQLLALHTPNVHPLERPAFYPVCWKNDSLQLLDAAEGEKTK